MRQLERDNNIPIRDVNYLPFEDGEGKVRSEESVRTNDIFLIALQQDYTLLEEQIDGIDSLIEKAFSEIAPDVAPPNFAQLLEPYLRQQGSDIELASKIQKRLDELIPKFDVNADLSKRILETFKHIRTLKNIYGHNISLITPYFTFTRGDRPTGKEASIAKLMTDLYVEAGADHFVSMQLHAPQEREYTNKPFENLKFLQLMMDYIINRVNLEQKIVIVAPDAGAAKVAQKYVDVLQSNMGYGNKIRIYSYDNGSSGHVENIELIGDVEDAYIIVIDDETASGSTLLKLLEQAKAKKAKKALIGVAHGKLVGAEEKFSKLYEDGFLDEVVITDSINHSNSFIDRNKDWLTILDSSRIFAQAIYNIHCYKSMEDMYNNFVVNYARIIHSIRTSLTPADQSVSPS